MKGGLSVSERVYACACAALLPNAKGAVLGKVPKGEKWDKVASEAARTIPGRENGGNCDIKNLSRGCKVRLLTVHSIWHVCMQRAPARTCQMLWTASDVCISLRMAQ